jgi:hypothetical protein
VSSSFFEKILKGKRFLQLAVLVLLSLVILWETSQLSKTVHPSAPSSNSAQITRTLSTLDALAERQIWSQRIDQVGAATAYTEFKDKFHSRGFGDQHFAAHVIGALFYDKLGLAGVADCDASFAFGCYHSFFGRALEEQGLGVMPSLDQACLKHYGPTGTGCLHGIGHGLMEYFGPTRLLEALNGCLLTTQTNPLFGCTTGVFMEYNTPILIDSTTIQVRSRDFNPTDPFYPCSTLPEKFQQPCYFQLPQWWNGLLSSNYAKIGELCESIPTPQNRESCFLGTGNDAAPSSEYDLTTTIKHCQQMPNSLGRLNCLVGASWSFMTVPEKRPLAPEVCSSLSETDRHLCVQKGDLAAQKS